MKLFLLTILLLLATSFCIAQKKNNITFEWVYENVIEGYDHDNRCEVYINNKKVTTSTVTKQSKKNHVTITVPKGVHKIKLVNFALYNGEWEEHTKANEYSVDAIYELTIEVQRSTKKKISLKFDIESEKVIVNTI